MEMKRVAKIEYKMEKKNRKDELHENNGYWK